jgi:predicted Zn-dependent protease
VNGEDELAGTIGHEIGHVAARHHVQRATLATPFTVLLGLPAAIVGTVSGTLGKIVAVPGMLTGGLILAKHSREQEREADRLGIEFAASGGWDPRGLAAFLKTLGREDELARGGPRKIDFFDSHPSTPQRVEDASRLAETTKWTPSQPIAASRSALLDRLEGILVGPNPAEGVFVEGEFLHPELGFALSFPPAWENENKQHFALAVAPEEKGKTAIVLSLAGEGEDPSEGARADELDERLVRELEPVEINGLRAVRLVTEKRGSGFDLTWIAHGGRVYRIAGVSPVSDFARYRDTFAAAARSFRPLGSSDWPRIRENRLRVRPSREGEGLSEFLERTGGAGSVEETAVANGLEDDVRLDGGQLLKVAIPQRYTPPRQ